MARKRTFGYLTQDIGLVLLIGCFITGTIAVSLAPKDIYFESIVMLIGTCAAILFAGFKLTSFACVVAGFEILLYTAYRLYWFLAYDVEIQSMCYFWIVLPIAAVGAMYLFVSGSHRTELENDVLREQVDELVMIDPLTKLYNLRSLYADISRMIAYTERNKMSLSLMIIVLKYEPELASVLSRRNYEEVLQRLAVIVSDTVRVEDKAYTIDPKGSLGVLLTCDKVGSEFVIKRIKERVADKDAFAGIMKSPIKVEVRIACLEYDATIYGNDFIRFKQKVENELQYDV